MELQDLEKMINTYLNDVEAFGEEGEYETAKEILVDFLLYFQSMDDDFEDGVDEYYGNRWSDDSDYDDEWDESYV